MSRQGKSLELSCANLERTIEDLYTLAESHQEVTQKNIDAALKVAEDLAAKWGNLTFSADLVAWSAKNQADKSVRPVLLPKMMIGSQWLGQINDPSSPVPVVDGVRNLLDVTCTIFQRMSEGGDMLRVAPT